MSKTESYLIKSLFIYCLFHCRTLPQYYIHHQHSGWKSPWTWEFFELCVTDYKW